MFKIITATELIKNKIEAIPSLWGGLLTQGELAGLVGPSDVGKSTLAKALSLAIVFKKDSFLGIPLTVNHGNVLYVSTEDGINAIAYVLQCQLGEDSDKPELSGLGFVINDYSPLKGIENELKSKKYDLIVIDGFGDLFQGDPNNLVSVRGFLKKYKALCESHGCTILLLHHITKSSSNLSPSKNNINGSVAFENVCRTIIEMRADDNTSIRTLTPTKGNYIPDNMKKKPISLNFSTDTLTFEAATDNSFTSFTLNKREFSDVERDSILTEALKLRANGLSYDKIHEDLKGMSFRKVPSKGRLFTWMKKCQQKENKLENLNINVS